MALNKREKQLIGGLALVGILLGGYTYLHEPLRVKRAEAHNRLQETESQLIQERKRLNREGDLAERQAKVTAREQLVDSWVPGKNSAAMLVWHLSQAELLSGARILSVEVRERESLTVAPEPEPAAGAEPSPANGMTTLVVVPLEVKLMGRFADHLIFDQYLEQAPLFLNTPGFTLERQLEIDGEKIGRLIRSGNPWLAEQLLTQSPPVEGTYRFKLYFKAAKAGPSTDSMHFDSQPGRIDPFVLAGVDELIAFIQRFFADLQRLEEQNGSRDPRLPPQTGPSPQPQPQPQPKPSPQPGPIPLPPNGQLG